jgi:aerotaxis receptor
MKNNQPITQQERHFPEGVPLVSTTDVKGKITFVNDAFVDICGFTRDELIGQSHNIVRHPDVPPAAFGDLWGTLKKGKPWMGVVKNRTKNGGFYWVNAFVTPIVENGSVIGYQSVRVKPKKSQVDRAESIYKRVNAGERRINRFDLPVSKVLPALMPVAVFLPVLLSYFLELDRNIALAVSLSVGIATALLSLWFMKPLTLAAKRLSRDSDNALLAEMYTGFSAEVGRLEHSSLMKKANEDAIRARIQFSAKELNELGDETHEIAEQAATAVNQQGCEVQHISAAISQMAAAIDEVAC